MADKMIVGSGLIHQQTFREVVLTIGETYRIWPLNPRAKKNRDREVLLVDFVKSTDGKHDLAKVKYLDTNRPGKVEPSDLTYLSVFYEWLMKQSGRDDPIGDLASDTMRVMRELREDQKDAPPVDSDLKGDWLGYYRWKGEHVKRVFLDAWQEYKQ